jgi:spermidine/putrescine transport system substrate-binding protein
MAVGDVVRDRLERRVLLRRAMGAALGIGAGSLLAACGDGSSSSGPKTSPSSAPSAADVSGTAVYLNYPGWIGSDNVADFEVKYPNAKIKQTASGFESLGGVAQTIAQDPKAYDMLLGDTVIAGQLDAGDLLLPIDESNVPSLSLVQPRMRELFPWGMPLDNDTLGIGYRTDIVKEPITSWADFWNAAPNYSNQIVLCGIDRYTLGCALVYLGLDPNTSSESDLNRAQDAVLQLKSDVLAFKVSNIAQPLLDGSAALTMGYSYETAAAMQKNPNIAWVFPSEGTVATIEGTLGVAATDVPDVVRAWMDFEMQPENYVDFIKDTDAPRVSNAIDDQLPKWLTSKVLDVPDNATIIKFVGADGTKLYNQTWSEIQAA